MKTLTKAKKALAKIEETLKAGDLVMIKKPLKQKQHQYWNKQMDKKHRTIQQLSKKETKGWWQIINDTTWKYHEEWMTKQ